MRKNYYLNTFLAAVLGIVLLAMVIIRAFFPVVILPEANIPNLVLLSLAALVLDHYTAPGAKRCYICILLLAAVTFGLLPYAAGFCAPMESLKLAAAGGIVFTMVTWLFSSMMDRLRSGPAAKAAPLLSALGLYLASQCFMGMIL